MNNELINKIKHHTGIENWLQLFNYMLLYCSKKKTLLTKCMN